MTETPIENTKQNKFSTYAGAIFDLIDCSDEYVFPLLAKMKRNYPLSPEFINDVLKGRNFSNVELFKIASLISCPEKIERMPKIIVDITGNAFDRYLIGMLLGMNGQDIYYTEPLQHRNVDELKNFLITRINDIKNYGSTGKYILTKLGVISGVMNYTNLDVTFTDELFNHFIVKEI